MVLDAVSNFVRGQVDAAITTSDTTVSVVDASIFPDPATDGEFNVVVWNANNFPRPDQDGDVEILRVTARDTTADEVTVVRAQEGTAAAAHPEGSAVHLSPTAKMFGDIEAEYTAQGENFDGEGTSAFSNLQSVSTEGLNNTATPTAGDDIQQIIDNLGDGATIKLRANTVYELDSGLIITHNDVTIEGPRSAVLNPTSAFGADTVIEVGRTDDAANFTARGFTIDAENQETPSGDLGNEDTLDGHGIHIVRDSEAPDPGSNSNAVDVTDSLVDGVRFVDVKNEAVCHFGEEEGRTNFDLDAVVKDCIIENYGHSAIHCHNDHDVRILNNTIKNSTSDRGAIRHGVRINGNTIENVEGTQIIFGSAESCTITENFIRDCTGRNAIETWRNRDHVENNYIVNFDGTYAIHVGDTRGGGAVESNWIVEGKTRPIRVDGTEEIGSGDADIKSNHIRDVDTDIAIELYQVDSVSVIENTIVNNNGTVDTGILSSQSDSVFIANNNFVGVDTPVNKGNSDVLWTPAKIEIGNLQVVDDLGSSLTRSETSESVDGATTTIAEFQNTAATVMVFGWTTTNDPLTRFLDLVLWSRDGDPTVIGEQSESESPGRNYSRSSDVLEISLSNLNGDEYDIRAGITESLF